MISIQNKQVAAFLYIDYMIEDDYKNEEAWKAREFIETSYSIKSPSVFAQIANNRIFHYLIQRPPTFKRYMK